jgi:hypothetical protein
MRENHDVAQHVEVYQPESKPNAPKQAVDRAFTQPNEQP